MANGKGRLDCWDCKHGKIIRKQSFSWCKKYNVKLPEPEEIEYQHRFCSEFIPKWTSARSLINTILKENEKSYYYIYKPGSKFLDFDTNKKIELKDNILYGYIYLWPDKIEELNDLKVM